ncbi:zinc-dependent metallopeptidase [Legionella gratiana]|uniref:Zinc-dependent metallopeptidase n=1 Tax=Legionella gratiana TaxID=45066 RepID=A0A378JE10_9GAMM|nr:M2 family metallopeptidase [Legionella gratiana]KTD13647.1 zinc-dependent metallopeptidase [Legionella gratiana]STX46042.1 zinc-dependent metallopeptidase [Legionella gratiana]
MKHYFTSLLISAYLLLSCHSDNIPNRGVVEAQNFIDSYTKQYVLRYTNAQKARWKANIEIKPDDVTNAMIARKADEALAVYIGSKDNIKSARKYLAPPYKLTKIQVKQLELILYSAANSSQEVADLVKKRIKAEVEQIYKLYGYQYILDGKKIGIHDIDYILKKEIILNKRLSAWDASKQVGPTLKAGLINLRNLRNQIVQSLGYPDFFTYQVNSYHMSTDEMMQTMERFMKELYPLYRELHTWVRYELAKRYGVSSVPEYLPAHWLPNRWGQDWSSILKVKGINLDDILKNKSPAWIMKSAESLYVSLGYPKLPETFWKKSNPYPYPSNSSIKKNNHASAWHMDLDQDIRVLMSLESNVKSFRTAHHELGHIYYYLTYTNKNVPPLLRKGANRAYHEAIGTMMGHAALQRPYLVERGLIDASVGIDNMHTLLKEALNSVVFIFFSAGTMSHFEKAMYVDNLAPDQFNAKWWELAKKYQGIEPPFTRGEEYCDAATKTHINNDPAQYYDYALSYALLYQLHNHIAKNILHQDIHATNYFGQKAIGDFLIHIMRHGASKDWRQVLKESTSDELSAKAMSEYFQPLVHWLHEQNKGRKYSLPEIME